MKQAKNIQLDMKNIESDDVSNLLELALSNIKYSKEKIIHYTLLIEEALTKWREKLPKDNQLLYRVSRKKKNIIFTFQIEGKKVDPFVVVSNIDGESAPLDKMVDNLLSGVGSEIKYLYKKGKNIIKLKLPVIKDYEKVLFVKNLVFFMLPIAIQQFFLSIANNVDSIMLGFLDADSMSATSLVSKFAFIPDLLGISIAIAGSAVLSQFWGKRDRKSVNQSAGVILKFALIVGVFFALISFLFPKEIVGSYTNDTKLIELGSKYLKIIAIPIFLNVIERVLFCFMQVVGDVKRSLRYSIIASLLNVLFNSVLIFGLFGLPKMGIVGAGISTIISFSVQGILLIIYTIKNKEIRINFITKSKEIIKPTLKILLPTALQYLVWLLFTNFATSAFGHKDSNILAANSVLTFIYNALYCGAVGFRSGTAIWIARFLGRNQFEIAKERASQVLKITSTIALCIIPLFILVGFLVHFLPLDLSKEALHFYDIILTIDALNLFFAYENNVLCGGILQTGGDTIALLIIDSIISIGVMVVISVLSITEVVNIPATILVVILNADEILSFPLKFGRYKQNKWLKNITKKQSN